MANQKQLAVAFACGLGFAAVLGLVMGSGRPAATPGIAGVTGYSVDGIHYAVAWEAQGVELVPVSRGRVVETDEALFNLVVRYLPTLVSKAEEQQALIDAMQMATRAPTPADREVYFKKAADIIVTASNCPGCVSEYRQCGDSPVQCLERLVMCKGMGCH